MRKRKKGKERVREREKEREREREREGGRGDRETYRGEERYTAREERNNIYSE